MGEPLHGRSWSHRKLALLISLRVWQPQAKKAAFGRGTRDSEFIQGNVRVGVPRWAGIVTSTPSGVEAAAITDIDRQNRSLLNRIRSQEIQLRLGA